MSGWVGPGVKSLLFQRTISSRDLARSTWKKTEEDCWLVVALWRKRKEDSVGRTDGREYSKQSMKRPTHRRDNDSVHSKSGRAEEPAKRAASGCRSERERCRRFRRTSLFASSSSERARTMPTTRRSRGEEAPLFNGVLERPRRELLRAHFAFHLV